MGKNINSANQTAMKHLHFIFLLVILPFLLLFYSCKDEGKMKITENGIALQKDGESLHVLFYSDRIVRIVHSPLAELSKRESIVTIKKMDDVDIQYRETQDTLELISNSLIVSIDKESGRCFIKDKQGKMLLEEKHHEFKKDTVMYDPCYNALQKFKLSDEEALYGLGQHQDGIMNWRGKEVILVQTNVNAVSPFLISTGNYGILWDNYSKTLFKDTDEDAEFWSEVADQIDYYFIAGNIMDDVISGYRDLTGQVPMFGKWAYGYWQSKERYVDAEDITNIAAEYRKRSIPIDNIVQDWRYWAINEPNDPELSRQSAKDQWSSMEFHPSTYPFPSKTIAAIHHQYNMHYMISIWPTVGRKTKIFDELNAGGYLMSPETWSSAYLYDAYSQEARNIYWKHIREGLMQNGVDALWMDGTEPELADQHYFDDSEKLIKNFGKNEIGSMARYLNTYSLMTTKGVYENWRRDFPDKRVCILTRSGFAGQQRNAAVTWSGDINATWDVLRNQISAGLNFSMAGMPYWTMDIGAFFMHGHDRGYGEGTYESNEDPSYRELYVRWFQFGAFCPIFRSHGTHAPREIWRFGEPGSITFESLLKFDNLRYRLLPYIYSLAWKVTSEGYTMIRGLAMDFSQDKQVLGINNQFMFGSSIMVRPVTEEQYFPKSGIATREVKGVESYLPAETDWYDFWSGQRFEGGQRIWKPTPLDIMPVYIKAGSILPLGPFKQYATEIPENPIELRIYPGADGSFVLYEDENDNYNYEKGKYATIQFLWNDKDHTLTIGKRQGEFQGMIADRIFNVVIVAENNGVGEANTEIPDKAIDYSGEEMIIVF